MGWNLAKPTAVVLTSQHQSTPIIKLATDLGEEVGFEWAVRRRKYCLWAGKWDSLVNRDNSNPHHVSQSVPATGQSQLTPNPIFSSPSLPPRLIYPAPCRRYLRSEICLIIIIWYSVLVCINNTSDESQGGGRSIKKNTRGLTQVPCLLVSSGILR